jgi:protoporphyrinogen oxidase
VVPAAENEQQSTTGPGDPIVVIGAGPAGLTAAYELVKHGDAVVVLEADDVVGGISRTVERDGWRFDIGGHRFFTKVRPVEDFWHEVLPPEDFLLRPRMSRIFYRGKFYDYPLKAGNALGNLGLWEAFLCGLSYLWARIRPPKDQTNYEGWLVARFGWRLYRTFFKTYTEKVWGVPVSDMPADWAAQRVKNLDLGKAVLNAITPSRNQKDITSLIEEFQYPKYGPGMMWERCRDLVEKDGAIVRMNTEVRTIHVEDGRATGVTVALADGSTERIAARHVISTMPMAALVRAIDPPPPAEVVAAGKDLHYRDFLTVALVVPEAAGFPDNWIYIHATDVKVGRIQNFGSWSPYMVKDGRTCLGMEYFVFEGDELWASSDEDLVARATAEIQSLGLVSSSDVEVGYVVRVPKAYPYYDTEYRSNVAVIAAYLDSNAPNVHPVGRNGMHKYNNQDHSMYTAMLTVENIHGASHDIWAVNVEEEYHEEGDGQGAVSTNTGRDAPILPRRTPAAGAASVTAPATEARTTPEAGTYEDVRPE